MTKKPSNSSMSAQKVRFLSILPHPKPSFMLLAYCKNPNNNLNTEKVEIELLNNIYNPHNMRS